MQRFFVVPSLEGCAPAEHHITTANRDGFTSYWSIEEDVFYLDSIRCEHYDINSRKITGERIPNDTLLRVFKNFVEGERIVASWLTDDIRVATGKIIYYQHMGFERNYEREQIFTIREGKVIGKKIITTMLLTVSHLIKSRGIQTYGSYFL